jgi:4-amino-4-deoxy-L-arabinose transferase-like glycosyltransferase
MAFALTARERQWLAWLIVAIVGIRLVTLAAYPLTDPTEARYGEIARKMLETRQWIMPQFEYGVPFWGKPPLSTWLSAASMAAFGVNEFAARLPSLLLMLACGALVYFLGSLRANRDAALWSLALFATIGLIFVAAGVVMTDPALTLGTTLAMAGFWAAVNSPQPGRRMAGFAFFVGLAIGFLSKGPVAAILALVPVGAWTLWTRRWREVWSRLPWLSGTVLLAALVVPWYWAAEKATPGFLEYFLVGEHWKRFTQPGWTGDLYGAAHARPRGMIWLFWLGVALPWSLVATSWLARAATMRRGDLRALIRDPWRTYLALWAITPMLFFTVSGNVLPTYVLPGLPALTLLVADYWRPSMDDVGPLRATVRQVLVSGVVICALFVTAIVVLRGRMENELSHKALTQTFAAQRTGSDQRLVYMTQQPVSALFYSQGTAAKVADAAGLAPYLADPPADFYAMRERDVATLPAAVRGRLAPAGNFGEYRLFRELPH